MSMPTFAMPKPDPTATFAVATAALVGVLILIVVVLSQMQSVRKAFRQVTVNQVALGDKIDDETSAASLSTTTASTFEMNHGGRYPNDMPGATKASPPVGDNFFLRNPPGTHAARPGALDGATASHTTPLAAVEAEAETEEAAPPQGDNFFLRNPPGTHRAQPSRRDVPPTGVPTA